VVAAGQASNIKYHQTPLFSWVDDPITNSQSLKGSCNLVIPVYTYGIAKVYRAKVFSRRTARRQWGQRQLPSTPYGARPPRRPSSRKPCPILHAPVLIHHLCSYRMRQLLRQGIRQSQNSNTMVNTNKEFPEGSQTRQQLQG
jgi:hypothetical protein